MLQSVDHALQILDLFDKYDELGLSEISKIMNIGKSTAFRLTSTLENRGYLMRNRNQKFTLGPRFITLGVGIAERMELSQILRPKFLRLSESINMAMNLVIWCDDLRVVSIDRTTRSNSHSFSFPGLHSPVNAHISGGGMPLLAAKSDEFIEEYARNVTFHKMTPYSITSADDLWTHINNTRRDGYFLNDQQYMLNLANVGMLIRNKRGESVAGISATGLRNEIVENLSYIVTTMRQFTDEAIYIVP